MDIGRPTNEVFGNKAFLPYFIGRSIYVESKTPSKTNISHKITSAGRPRKGAEGGIAGEDI